MKLNNHESHDHSHQKGIKGVPSRIKQYFKNLYNHSKKCSMSRGSANILRSLSWARGITKSILFFKSNKLDIS